MTPGRTFTFLTVPSRTVRPVHTTPDGHSRRPPTDAQRPSRWAPGAALAVALVVLVSACGGGEDPATSDSESLGSFAAQQSDANPGSTEDASAVDEPTGVRPAELHPTLAALPLPPDHEVPFPADDYPADVDERETVVQLITVAMPSDELARFLLAELPGAGFTIIDRGQPWLVSEADIQPDVEVWIYVETPDGLPAQLILQPQGEQTGINVNLYRAGDGG